LLTLTPKGKRCIARMIVKHKKVVKAWMRVLDSREQQTLGRLCQEIAGGRCGEIREGYSDDGSGVVLWVR
jgi:hypothetical protein